MKKNDKYCCLYNRFNCNDFRYSYYNTCGHGEEKLKAALDSLAERGYDIDSNRVIDAVRAAWKELDQAMYMDGEKKPEI